MGDVSNDRPAGLFRRGMAAGCITLILLLGVFAASPTLHALLHQDVDAAAPDQCAVVLFVTGTTVAPPLDVLPPTIVEWTAQPPAASLTLYLDSPRYLLRPERGPPLV